MRGRGPRRRLRIRRKRKGGGVREAAENAGGEVVTEVAGEVVYQTGWCLLEAVVSASVVLALVTVPAYLLIR